MEKNIITNLRNVNALFSEKTLHKLGKITVDEELYCFGLEIQAICNVTGRINEYNNKIEEYEDLKVGLTHLRGMARLEQGKSAEAYEDFCYVINSDYSEAEVRNEARFLAGLATIQLGKTVEGINHLNEFLQHNQTSVDVIYWLGVAYYLSDDLDTAEEHFDAAILDDPGFEDAYIARGKVHILSGNLESALDDFYKIIGLNPKNAEAQDFIRMVEAIQKI